jgi:hypothetical protein
LTRIAECLAQIQNHVSVLLKMPAEIKGSGAGHHRGSHAALGRDTDRHRKRDDQHRQTRTPLEPQLDTIDEFIAIRSLKITLGSDEIPVGKCALFFRGRYLEIGDEEVTVEPLSEYVSGRYVGATHTGDHAGRVHRPGGPERR